MKDLKAHILTPNPFLFSFDQDIFSLCFDVHGGAFVLGGYNATIHDPNREIVWVPYSGGSSR